MAQDPKDRCPELWEENARLRALVELGRALADPEQSLEQKLFECVKVLASLTKAESCSLMLVEGEELVVRAANHPGLVGMASKLSEDSISTEVVKTGRPIYTKEVGQSAYAGVRRQGGKRSYRTGSLVCLPLLEGGRVVGVLNLADKAGAPFFDEQDAAMAQDIAREASRLINFSALHARLERAYQELSEAQRDKEDLMYMIFHDMKAPVTGVKEVLGLLGPEGGLSPEEQAQCLAAAQDDLELLWRRITNLLDLKRMDAGQFPLTPLPLNLAQLAREAAGRMKPLGRARRVEISVEAGAEPEVTADEDLVERILMNLLFNALKFSTPEEGGGGRVRLWVGAGDGWALARVKDSGPGVDPALGQAIFERFVQGRASRGSTGLGLYFCQRAAGLLGGEVRFCNQPDGAEFFLRLPLDSKGQES